MTTPDNNTPSDPAAEISSAERANRGVRKTRNIILAIWAYVFYGALLVLGILLVAAGITEGWIFIGAAVILFAMYWLFGYVLCCR